MFKSMLIAGLGGFFGTCARYLVGVLAKHMFVTVFPVGTFAVNVVGSFVIGLLYGLAERHGLLSGNMSLLLITGFCGGFTTFSSFADDGFLMLQQRHWSMLLLYFGLSLALGVLMVWIGRGVVKTL